MKSLKSLVVAALALSATGAMAGEILNSSVYGYGADNQANGTYSYATQGIGVASGNGKIHNSSIDGTYARNRADGYGSQASQEIGVASYGGRLNNVNVYASGAVRAS